MNLFRCVSAYSAMLAMHTQEFDYASAYALVSLKRKLQPHINFFIEEEEKLVAKYAAKDEDGKVIWTKTGNIRFDSDADAIAYGTEREKLGVIEANEEFEVMHLPIPERITPQQLEALEGFIVFGKEAD